MTSQLVKYAKITITLAVAWLAVVWATVSIVECSCVRNLIIFAPALAVIALGLYAAFSVLYGVATFNDCAAAREELVEEIKEAQADLKEKKIID